MQQFDRTNKKHEKALEFAILVAKHQRMTSKELAEKLGLSQATVSNRRKLAIELGFILEQKTNLPPHKKCQSSLEDALLSRRNLSVEAIVSSTSGTRAVAEQVSHYLIEKASALKGSRAFRLVLDGGNTISDVVDRLANELDGKLSLDVTALSHDVITDDKNAIMLCFRLAREPLVRALPYSHIRQTRFAKAAANHARSADAVLLGITRLDDEMSYDVLEHYGRSIRKKAFVDKYSAFIGNYCITSSQPAELVEAPELRDAIHWILSPRDYSKLEKASCVAICAAGAGKALPILQTLGASPSAATHLFIDPPCADELLRLVSTTDMRT